MLDLPAILKQAEALLDKEGWAWRPRADGGEFSDGTPVCEVVAADRTIIAYDVGEPEARFIAACRTNVPMLVAALQEAQELAMEMGASSSVQVQDFRDRLLAILGEEVV